MKKILALTAILTISVLTINIIGIPAVLSQEHELPELPGITVEDEKPNGCVDCHKPRPDIGMDFRLSLALPNEGNHPDVGDMVANGEIPTVCKTCHMDKLANRVHLVHLTGDRHDGNVTQNHFITSYHGQCLYCHDLDLDTGKMTIKTGYEPSP